MGNIPGELFSEKYSFLAVGEMGKRTSEQDWEKTTLGPPDKWPLTLRVTINTLLRNPLPAFFYWGSDLIIFYNDAVRLILEEIGDSIDLLGLSAKNALPQSLIVLQPDIDRVFRSGESVLIENKLMSFSKNKKEKQAYWTFSFSCLVNETGKPEGVLHTGIQMEECPSDFSGFFAEVKEHGEQLNYIINAAELGTWDIDTSTNKISLNERASEWFGLPQEENELDDLLNSIVINDRQIVINGINEALKPGSKGIYQNEYSILNPRTNQNRRVLARGKALFFNNDLAFRFSGILQDITEEFLLAEKIRNTEVRLLLAMETAEMGIWEFDISSQEINHTPKLASLLGFENSTTIGLMQMFDYVHPEDLPYLANDYLPELFRKGRMENEYRIIQHSGNTIWVRNHAKVILDEKGQALKLIGTMHDITDRKEREKKIEESEQNLRTIVESGLFPIAVYSDKEKRLEMANQAWLNLFSNGTNLIGKKYKEIYSELKNEEVSGYVDEAFKTGKTFQSRQERVDLERNGVVQTYYFDYVITPIKNVEGKIIRVINSAVDVTEAVLAKIKIEESEAGFRLLADSMPQFVWSGNKEGDILYINQAVFNYTGLTLEEITGKNWLNIIYEKDWEKTKSLLIHSLKTGDDFIVEHRFRRFDGIYRWQLSRAVALKDTNGEIQMWVGTSTDIQDIKEQEELKDFFISMASHELKTPITSLKAYVQILLSNYQDSEDLFLLKSLKIADKQIVKLTNLISELLDISKIKSGKLSLKMDEFLLNELVSDTIEEFSVANPDYKINFHCGNNLPVMADFDRISQVIINFLSNAIKYSPDIRNIEVTCQVKNEEVEVSVLDFGMGINKEDMPRIFDRFYRGGGINEKTIPGFGIGLFIAEEIIKRHGGNIGAESEHGKGSRFYFTLPLIK